MWIRLWWLVLVALVLSSCFKGEKADLIVFNAKIASQDGGVYQAMAIQEGKIIELGPEREILNRYRSKNEINGAQKSFYPSFIDANASLLKDVQCSIFFDASSMETVYELLMNLEKRREKNKLEIIVAFNYSLNNWQKEHQEMLEERFPNEPVVIYNSTFTQFVSNDLFRGFTGVDSSGSLIVEDRELNSLTMLPSLSLEKQKEAFTAAIEERKMMGYQALVLTVENLEEVELLSFVNEANPIGIPLYLFLNRDVVQVLDQLEEVHNINVLGVNITKSDTTGSTIEKMVTYAVDNQLLVRFPDVLLKNKAIYSYLSSVLSSEQDHRWQVMLSTIDQDIVKMIEALNLIPVITPLLTYVDQEALKQIAGGMYLIGNAPQVQNNTPFDLTATVVDLLNTKKNEGLTFSKSDVLKGLTLYGAYGIQQEKQIGGLEKGKIANFVQLVEPFGNHSPNRPNYVEHYFLVD